MTAQQLGDTLRRQRERRGVALSEIAEATKIGKRLLADLEHGDCSRWPGGIYARAYFRAYAGAIGFDPEELIPDFCEVFPQFAPPAPIDPEQRAGESDLSVRRGWLAHLRDVVNRADGRFDLLFRIERSE